MASVPVWRGRDGRLAPEDRTRIDAAIDVSENLGAVIGDVEAARDVASDHAEEAGAQADIALDAVIISRAQADGAMASAVDADQRARDADGSAVLSAQERVAAEAARLQAEAFASAAAGAGAWRDTIALGRAAVADGQSFGVRAGGADGLLAPTVYRRDSAATQTLIIDAASAGSVRAVDEARQGVIRSGGTGPFEFTVEGGKVTGGQEAGGHWSWPWIRTEAITIPGPSGDQDLVQIARTASTDATVARAGFDEAAPQITRLSATLVEDGENVFAFRLSSGGSTFLQRPDGILEAPGLEALGPITGARVSATEVLGTPTGSMVYDLPGTVFAHLVGPSFTFWQDSDGLFNVPSLRAHGAAAVDGNLNVGGQLRIGGRLFQFDALPNPGPAPVVNPVPFVSPASLAVINTATITQGDGTPIPAGNERGPTLSVDAAAYGWRYAQLASSCLWVGDRLWVAIYGQNTEPTGPGEVTGAFTWLQYTDNFFDDAPIWHEVLYVVPEVIDDAGSTIDPMISLMPDGRMLVQVATANRTGRKRACYGFLIQNPQAIAGTFDVGRIYWMGPGIPARPKQVGTDLIAAYDDWGSPRRTYLRKLVASGADAILATDYGALPDLPAEATWSFPETALDAISGGRINAIVRTTSRHYVMNSDPGGASWSTPPSAWMEYQSGNTRATQGRSPSGRLVRVWNNNPTTRDNLSVALSEDDGGTFPWAFEIDRFVSLGQYPNYPSVDFKVIAGEAWVFVSYDFGRTASQQKSTKIAAFREELLRAGTLTLADITYRIASN